MIYDHATYFPSYATKIFDIGQKIPTSKFIIVTLISANQYMFKKLWMNFCNNDGWPFPNQNLYMPTIIFFIMESTFNYFLITVTFILLVEAITTYLLVSTAVLTTFS